MVKTSLEQQTALMRNQSQINHLTRTLANHGLANHIPQGNMGNQVSSVQQSNLLPSMAPPTIPSMTSSGTLSMTEEQ